MQAVISAIGNAVPQYRGSQSQIFELMSECLELNKTQKRILKTIYNEAGIDYRYSVLADVTDSNQKNLRFYDPTKTIFPTTQKRMEIYKQNALSLALAAVKDCLKSIPQFDLSTITHIITVSCTGMSAPGLDIEIVQQLKLLNNIKRTTINFMGCYGAFNGLKLADSICKANPSAKVLLVSVELCTIHFQKNNSLDSLISSAIFSDGAAAVLIEGNPSTNYYFTLIDFYCNIVPNSGEEMTWDIGDQGFDIKLSTYVPRLIEGGIAQFAHNLMNRTLLQLSDIFYYAIHPGAKRILEICEAVLQIQTYDNRFSYEVLKNYGNMSSATILFVLKHIWNSITTEDNNRKIFSCAFGPGLTLESMLLNIHA